ncbi:hypothetical protein ACEN2I_13330 [Flavobacterium sp. W22_SRS_FK3]|uniref:hypothetical protein n=1 Tax=Flavobacterium sp. W22_SRS_FK3 TaxID=3240275 RepID=UPI003F8F4669
MKILKKVMFLAIAVFALALSSCSSNDSDENQTETDYIKFKYKGTTYTFDSGYQSSLTLDVIGSEGIDNTYKQITLWMPLDASVGSHPVVYDLSNLTTTYQASFTFMGTDNTFNATSGTIKITANNNERIEGTFNFSGIMNGQAVEVTDGKFSISQF